MGLIIKIVLGLLLIVVTLLVLFYFQYLRPSKSNPSITSINTTLNSKPAFLKLRRRRYNKFSDEEEDEADEILNYTFSSKPVPFNVKGCLKRRHLLPSGEVGSETSEEGGIDSDSVATDDEGNLIRKSVRLLEPSKASLEALREYWSNSNDGEGTAGLGVGIGGYRSTSSFFVKGQGGTGKSKRDSIANLDLSTMSPTTTDQSNSLTSIQSPLPRTSPRLNSPTSSSGRHLSPSPHSHSHSPSPSRASTLRPRTSSPSPASSLIDQHQRIPSPSNFNRTGSPLGIRRRRTGSNASLPGVGSSNLNNSNFNSNSNNSGGTANVISVSERSTPRWIQTKNVSAVALNSPTKFDESKSSTTEGKSGETGTEEQGEDSDYEDVSGGSGASTPAENSFSNSFGSPGSGMTSIIPNFPIPPSSSNSTFSTNDNSNSNKFFNHSRSPASSIDYTNSPHLIINSFDPSTTTSDRQSNQQSKLDSPYNDKSNTSNELCLLGVSSIGVSI